MMSLKTITQRILPLLRDPETGADLSFDGEAFVGGGARFPIIDDIPRFVSSDQYVKSFSFEWNTHHNTQLDCHRGDQASENEFIQKTNFTPEDVRGKLVLDAGVGAGRYADIVSRWGGDVVGVDLSFAVEASHRNFHDRDNVWIAQADIGKLPFKPESFDVIFSIGVLHHTPNTKDYFMKLIPLLKPGGTIVIWVYPNDEAYATRARWIPYVNKLPIRMFYAWCRWFVPWATTNLDNPWVGAIRRIFPFPTHGLGFEHDILDTFDGYSPRFHGIHSPEEVEGWFREAGLINVYQPSNWTTCMRGFKKT